MTARAGTLRSSPLAAKATPWATIERRFGVSARQARRIVKDLGGASAATTASIDPMAIVEAALLRCEVLIEDLAVIADTAENQAVAVNAIRAQIRSTDHRLALLRDAGVLPMPLSCLAQHFDAERAASHATEVLDRHRAPADVKRALVAALRGSRHPTTPAGTPTVAQRIA